MASPAHICAGCDKVSSLRCAPCAKVGVDTAYCSVDHQKMLWKVHKNYCGQKPQVFFQPALQFVEYIYFAKNVGFIIGGFDSDYTPAYQSYWIKLCTTYNNTGRNPNLAEETWPNYQTFIETLPYWEVQLATAKLRQSCCTFASGPRENIEVATLTTMHPNSYLFGNQPICDSAIVMKNPERWMNLTSNYFYATVNHNAATMAYKKKEFNSTTGIVIGLWKKGVAPALKKLKEAGEGRMVPRDILEVDETMNNVYRW